MLWGFVICASAAEIEPETLQILYLNGNYLTALVQHLKISSIKKTSHADLGEELVHKTSHLNIRNSENGQRLTMYCNKEILTFMGPCIVIIF